MCPVSASEAHGVGQVQELKHYIVRHKRYVMYHGRRLLHNSMRFTHGFLIQVSGVASLQVCSGVQSVQWTQLLHYLQLTGCFDSYVALLSLIVKANSALNNCRVLLEHPLSPCIDWIVALEQFYGAHSSGPLHTNNQHR